jgi:hypothetical protein
MLKTKRSKKVLVGIVIFSMVAMYGYMPVAKAAGLTSAKDTLSNSAPTVATTHTIAFKAGYALSAGTVITVTFADNFGNLTASALTCPAVVTDTPASTTHSVSCTATAAWADATTTIIVAGVTNPTPGDYDVTISHNEPSHNETSQMKVYIIDNVTVSAHVNSSLTFEVATTSAGATIDTLVTTTGTSSPTAINFGTLLTTGSQTIAQTLKVSTNATAGYVVTVQQDKNMTSAAGADIDPRTGARGVWSDPVATLGNDATYGYIGVTSNDRANYPTPFGSDGQFEGLSTSPLAVMGHNGPADLTDGVGTAQIAYKIGITALQEAGDYSNTVTYICTPTF